MIARCVCVQYRPGSSKHKIRVLTSGIILALLFGVCAQEQQRLCRVNRCNREILTHTQVNTSTAICWEHLKRWEQFKDKQTCVLPRRFPLAQ